MKLFVIILVIHEILSIHGHQLIRSMCDTTNTIDAKEGNSRSVLIFPGTKWCGEGNNAENDGDLGYFEDTDRCCRAHDMCPENIAGFETKHNLTNPNFFTRLPCECDFQFHDCLKKANSKISTKIGIIYFDFLGTQCYKKDYPIIKCSNYTNFLHSQCSSYELDESKEKVYQFFDVPEF